MGDYTLNANLYLECFKRSKYHRGITGGTIHDFLAETSVEYCKNTDIYKLYHNYNGGKCFIGLKITKPLLIPNETIDYI